MITIIAAIAENNALGKDNQLLWHLPDDFKRFKNITTGHYIIMGRKTFESFPKPLPNRIHVIITRQKDYQPEAGSALDSAPDFEETFVKDIDEVLGGSSQLEKYATKSKKARYTKGEAIADEMEGRAQMELDRLKDEGILE